MIPVADAHFHIWRRKDLPWLDGPMQPRISARMRRSGAIIRSENISQTSRAVT